MAALHEYSVKGVNKRKVEAWLAVAALAVSIAVSIGFKRLITQEEWKWLEHYPFIFGTMTMTGLYGIVHSIYRKYLWKLVTPMADLNGIWAGWIKPEDADAYITVWTIEQDGDAILFDIEYFYSGFVSHDAGATSVVMTFDKASAFKMDMQMIYEITRVDDGRARYDGMAFCTIDMSTSEESKYSNQIYGTYFNNRLSLDGSHVGRHGRLLLQRVSKNMRDRDNVKNESNSKVLEALKHKILNFKGGQHPTAITGRQ